jgi:hypothetical protein
LAKATELDRARRLSRVAPKRRIQDIGDIEIHFDIVRKGVAVREIELFVRRKIKQWYRVFLSMENGRRSP